MATSAVAGGKVVVAAAHGDRLAPGILLDRHGEPTEDPREFAAGGSLLPAAGYKGFGLSAMIEALSIGVVGADGDGMRPRSGALVICIAGDAFRPARRGARLGRGPACAAPRLRQRADRRARPGRARGSGAAAPTGSTSTTT